MCVSNIAAGTKAQCMSLREGGIIAQLCAILESSGGQVVDMDKIQWKVVKETIWSLSNAVAHKIEDMNLCVLKHPYFKIGSHSPPVLAGLFKKREPFSMF